MQESVGKLWFEKFGVKIMQGYGVTEASPVISINTYLLNKKNTVGKILPGIIIKLLKINGLNSKMESSKTNMGKNYDKYSNNDVNNNDIVIQNNVEQEFYVKDSNKTVFELKSIGDVKFEGELYVKGDNIMKGYLNLNSLDLSLIHI